MNACVVHFIYIRETTAIYLKQTPKKFLLSDSPKSRLCRYMVQVSVVLSRFCMVDEEKELGRYLGLFKTLDF
jgi:hypothetical protein